ncbi:DUF7009 family protein [Armatimonas rosea]|uniref:Uncharacterized protein n=1 Tax=Armatimonas rosea TaxID=685828 RepID=A0A7W9SS84_ARMRO|nr:hypothetical protein [Armatimonas rosea]MBB6051118.1 hypothetical protein [Armatimonas rosea]
MKVRWMESSLRLRITPSELAALEQGEPTTLAATFPGGWSVTLQLGEGSGLEAPATGTVVLTLSPDSLATLRQPETEGVYFTSANQSFTYFVEKDFPCLHPRPEPVQEQSETFPAPDGFAERHRTA